MPACLDAQQSDSLALRLADAVETRGWGLWAVEVPGEADFIGYVGLNPPAVAMPMGECVELAWRLARSFWRRGFASEAARAALDFGFSRLGLAEIVSYTVPRNRRSWAVMERIGMTRDPDGDFDHPALPEGHPLRRHLLYRKGRP